MTRAIRALVLLACGLYGNVIRVTPPLNIARSDVDEFIRLLDSSLTAAARITASAGAR